MEDNGIRSVKWPWNSPDMNPIENGFGLAKSSLAHFNYTNRAMVTEKFTQVK